MRLPVAWPKQCLGYYNAMLSFLCRALRAERHELPALAWSFAYFFTLLAGYYVLRPVRDEMGVQAGLERLYTRWSADED